jgi:hypothetical protein
MTMADLDQNDYEVSDAALDSLERELSSVKLPMVDYCADTESELRFHLHVMAPMMLREIRRHRAARAAREERVREVVRESVSRWFRGSTSLDGVDIVEDIATRAAKQLAMANAFTDDAVRLIVEAALAEYESAHRPDENGDPHQCECGICAAVRVYLQGPPRKVRTKP